MATSGLTAEQVTNATRISQLAEQAGLTPQQATQMIGAAYAESGLREGSVNSKSGAFGLFQLLSSGYVSSYNKLLQAGNDPVTANIEAILPSYVAFYSKYPGALAGQGPAAVEASGEPASWYQSATVNASNLLEGAAGSATIPGALLGSGGATALPGVQTGVNTVKTLYDATLAVPKALAFIFSYRFLEILGGGVLILLGLYIVARQFQQTFLPPDPLGLGKRAVANEQAEKTVVREQRTGELHEARVAQTRARTTEIRSRSRARTTKARLTKEAAKREYNRGALDQATAEASPTMTKIRRQRSNT